MMKKIYALNLLAFRAIALYCAYSAVCLVHVGFPMQMPGILGASTAASIEENLVFLLPMMLLLLAAAVAIWIRAPRMSAGAGRAPDTTSQEELGGVTPEFAHGALVLAVLFVCLKTLVDGLLNVATGISVAYAGDENTLFYWKGIGVLNQGVIQLCIGLALLYFHRRLTKLITRWVLGKSA